MGVLRPVENLRDCQGPKPLTICLAPAARTPERMKTRKVFVLFSIYRPGTRRLEGNAATSKKRHAPHY